MLIGEIKMHCSCAKSLIEGDKPLVHVGAGNLRLYADSRKCERLEGHICRNSSQRTRLAGIWAYLAGGGKATWREAVLYLGIAAPKCRFPKFIESEPGNWSLNASLHVPGSHLRRPLPIERAFHIGVI